MLCGRQLATNELMAEDCEEIEDDTPNIVSGEVVHSENGDISYRVLRKIGEGRCCVVYSGEATRDKELVALKFFRKGNNYEGALQREQYILDNFHDPSCNIVCCYGYLIYKGLHCLVQELLECNVRQIIFRNERQGLSPWGTLKFARDVLIALNALHQCGLVHADLKPANIMWSTRDGCFKCLDFGLTFHIEEEDLHQIQSSGYRAPEATAWNRFKDEQKRKRKRKLQGTYLHLNYLVTPTCKDSLNLIAELEEEKLSLDVGGDICSASHNTGDDPDYTQTHNHHQNLTSGKSSATNSRVVTQQEKGKNSVKCGENIHKISTSATEKKNGKRTTANEDDSDSDNVGNDEHSMAKPTSNNLYRCDSESSGVFSQGSSDRSQCPSRLSCDVETMLEAASHHDWRVAAQHRLPMLEDDGTEDDQNCDKDVQSTRTGGQGDPQGSSEHVVWRKRNARKENDRSRRGGKAGEETTERDEGQSVQEWRKTRRRSEVYKTIPRSLVSLGCPGLAVDMWSFGCLLTETLTGRKLFRAGDKLTNVLRPLQLLEMRLGESEAKYSQLGMDEYFNLIKDIIVRCLDENPANRLTSCDALSHALFLQRPSPSPQDHHLLPAGVTTDSQHQDLLRDIRAECSSYGEILECVVGPGGHAYVHFQEEAWLIL